MQLVLFLVAIRKLWHKLTNNKTFLQHPEHMAVNEQFPDLNVHWKVGKHVADKR